MNWRPTICWVVASVCAAPASGQTLIAERLRELRTLSVCPARPTVAVVGNDYASLLMTRLSQASPQLDQIERQRLDAVMAEQCLGPEFDPSTTAPAGGVLFAMYLVKVTSSPGSPVVVDVMRTDSGEIIFHTSGPPPTSMGALDAFLTTAAASIQSSVASHPYACVDEFSAVISEDVTLACHGTVAASGTQYSVTAAFTVEFSIDGLNAAQRGTPQSLTGAARLLPAKALTTLRDSVTRTSARCAFTATTSRAIAIQLEPTTVPASYSLTIPQQAVGPWQFAPQLNLTPPLFRGPASLQMTMTTDPAANCDAPAGTTTRTSAFRHQELNQVRYGSRAVQPACTGQSVSPAFERAPNLGVPNAADITAGCSTSSAAARFSFQRRF